MEPNTSQSPTGGETNQQATPAPQQSHAQNNTLMGVLAYIGILVIIPYLMAKNEPFVKFHIRQGLVLVVIELVVMVAGEMVYGLKPILGLVNIAALVLSIIGIINVVQGNQKELPLVGQFAKHFNI